MSADSWLISYWYKTMQHCTCIACRCVCEYLNAAVGAEIEVVVSGVCNASVYNSPCWNIATLPHLG